MNLFAQIEDAIAIVRYPKGVQKQVKMYYRGDRVYIPHAGGYVEVRGLDFGHPPYHTTHHPDIKVMEFEASGVVKVTELGQEHLRWKPK